MENQELLNEVREKAKQWLSDTYDINTREEVQKFKDIMFG